MRRRGIVKQRIGECHILWHLSDSFHFFPVFFIFSRAKVRLRVCVRVLHVLVEKLFFRCRGNGGEGKGQYVMFLMKSSVCGTFLFLLCIVSSVG